MSEGFYTIEKIVDKKYIESRKGWIYMVKWEGFAESENTWEPEENLLPLGKMLENFNKAWENKHKPKVSEPAPKKPVVTKVKGLVELGEINSSSTQIEKPAKEVPKKLSMVDKSLCDESKAVEIPKVTEKGKSERKEKSPKKLKIKKVENNNLEAEGAVKLVSKKTLEKNAAKNELQIDLTNNLFKDCSYSPGSVFKDVPCKIIGCRKRNNIIQFAVLYQGPNLVYPSIVSYNDLLLTYPSLLAEYLINNQ